MSNIVIPSFLKRFLSLTPSERIAYAQGCFRDLQILQSKRLKDARDPTSTFSLSTALSPVVQDKNRYSDIIPFNHTRVVLKSTANDYINASHIVPPYNIPRSYIASQGPVEESICDFWTMILEQNSQIIVCLTPEVENGRQKCARYWPIWEQDRVKVFELGGSKKLIVECIQQEEYHHEAECHIRRINVQLFNDDAPSPEHTLSVTQLQFLGWQDHSALDSTTNILQLIQLCNDLQEQSDQMGPVTVHCSAGCGRTGTFCVVDSAIALTKMIQQGLVTDDGQDYIFELTDAFRRQRVTMVQAPAQYYFCYLALKDALEGTSRDSTA
ncbi:protein-tyrosine phosphatase-like protein [Umbelopsis sp. PMI_123]|jgi:protein tyrosine phosphatase|nr:protein-tyrosine phosphatase-like protein [Umbelopsis sp. PMI_123]